MMRLFVSMLLLTVGSLAQNSSIMFPVAPAGPVPSNVHDYALKVFKDYHDYEESRQKITGVTSMKISSLSWVFQGYMQSFDIDPDGKINLHNLTTEDALLGAMAFQTQDLLNNLKNMDAESDKKAEEREHNPPAKLKDGVSTYTVTPVKSLPNGYLETTNCTTKQIQVLMSDGAKRVGVLHEMMHVATDCDHSQAIHDLIYRIQAPLLKLMQDNPGMMYYLLKGKPTLEDYFTMERRKPSHESDEGEYFQKFAFPPTPNHDGPCPPDCKKVDAVTKAMEALAPPSQETSTFKICMTADEKDCIDVMCTGRNLVEGCPGYVPPETSIIAGDGSKVVKLKDEEYSHLQQLRQAVADEEKRLAEQYGARSNCDEKLKVCWAFPQPHEFHGRFLLIGATQ